MKTPTLTGQPAEEFTIRVNDFIEMANRLERRMDTAHAQMAFLHAFARYGAHHYHSTVTEDSAQEREAYAQYLADSVLKLVQFNLEQMRPSQAAGEPAAE